MRLVDGTEAIRGDLPVSATRIVPVPTDAGEAQETGVLRFTALHKIKESQSQVLAGTTGRVITIGGDCGVELAAIPHALHRVEGSVVAVIWFDAHGDLNTPSSSPSRAFSGMVLRTLLGEGPEALVPAHPLSADSIILAGVRSLDEEEVDFIESAGIRSLRPDELSQPEKLLAQLTEMGATHVYLHIDLDVIDPIDFNGIGYPEPFGVPAAALIENIRAVCAAVPLVGAGITQFAPTSPATADDDLPTILRIISALTR
jgi:arginase